MMQRKNGLIRRLLCLAVSVALCAVGMGAAFEAEDYTLPEKLQRQIDFGNGVKGAAVLTVAGENALAKLLAPLSGTEIQIRAIKSDGQYQLQFYTLDGERQVGLTQLYGTDSAVYLRSALLPDLLLTCPISGEWLDGLLGREAGANPLWYASAMNLFSIPETTWDENWGPLLQPYYTDVELWLNGYAEEPQVLEREDGGKAMAVRYVIPVQDMKDQAKALLSRLFSDEALLALLSAQVADDQQAVYLTPGLMYYYENAIDSLSMEGDILLERDLSTMGDTLATEMSFPLPQNRAGWTTLAISQTGEDTVLRLSGESRDMVLEMKQAYASDTAGSYHGTLRLIPADESAEALAVRFGLTRLFTQTVDADTRAHDRTSWELSLAPADVGGDGRPVMAFEPIKISLDTHFHSKNAKRNATTLEASLAFQQGTESFALTGSIVTSSPWVLENLPMDGAEDVSAMTDGYRGEILSQMLANAVAALSTIHPDALPSPDAATGTDLSAGE